MTPNVDSATSKLPSGNGSASASATWKVDGQALGDGAFLAAFEQGGDVVGRGHHRKAARRRKRGVAVAGGDIEHAFAGAQIDRLAELFADDLQRGADRGVVAGGPGFLLGAFDGGVVGRIAEDRHGVHWQVSPRK